VRSVICAVYPLRSSPDFTVLIRVGNYDNPPQKISNFSRAHFFISLTPCKQSRAKQASPRAHTPLNPRCFSRSLSSTSLLIYLLQLLRASRILLRQQQHCRFVWLDTDHRNGAFDCTARLGLVIVVPKIANARTRC